MQAYEEKPPVLVSVVINLTVSAWNQRECKLLGTSVRDFLDRFILVVKPTLNVGGTFW